MPQLATEVKPLDEKRGPAHPAGLSYTTPRSPQIDRAKLVEFICAKFVVLNAHKVP